MVGQAHVWWSSGTVGVQSCSTSQQVVQTRALKPRGKENQNSLLTSVQSGASRETLKAPSVTGGERSKSSSQNLRKIQRIALSFRRDPAGLVYGSYTMATFTFYNARQQSDSKLKQIQINNRRNIFLVPFGWSCFGGLLSLTGSYLLFDFPILTHLQW